MSLTPMDLIPFLDVTSLGDQDTDASISSLVDLVNNGPISPAAICVFPKFIDAVCSTLPPNSTINLCIVGPSFPAGEMNIDSRLNEFNKLPLEKVQEVDMVFNWKAFIERENSSKIDLDQTPNMIDIDTDKIRRFLPPQISLKTIIESGMLKEKHLIKKAARMVMESGGDFIKTSTGKEAVGARIDHFRWILEEIKSFYQQRGKRVGVKVAGGIKTFEMAVKYHQLASVVLGDDWVNPEKFRIGASSLFLELIDS